jgi:hypothetical protein
MTRRLIATRRVIPLDRLEEYVAGWHRLRSAAEAAGARAWLFRGTDHQDHIIEFIEWSDDGALPPPEVDGVAAARLDLDQSFGAGHADEWEELPAPREGQ